VFLNYENQGGTKLEFGIQKVWILFWWPSKIYPSHETIYPFPVQGFKQDMSRIRDLMVLQYFCSKIVVYKIVASGKYVNTNSNYASFEEVLV